MYQNMTPVIDGPFFYIETQYGAWFWVFIAYSYLLNTASMVILILALIKNPRLNFNQALVIAFIVIPPVFANILYVFRLMPELAYIDWTGPAFAISAICITVATTRQRLLDYLPVARDRAIEMMNDGYVVLDGDMRIIDLNEAMQKILDLPAGKAIGNTFPEIISEQMNLQADEAATMEIALGKQRKKRYYRVHCSPLKEDARSDEGRILLFYDITASKQIERKLAFMATMTTDRLPNDCAGRPVQYLFQANVTI
jgi:PAS domain S-box-containing protein